MFQDAYTLEEKQIIDEVKGTGFVFRHNKTKARIAVIHNEDDNKAFYIGFRTPPSDDTGVPHIIEHSVLCGSREFPAKDPFVELAKGSLNTFLNAMTYSDKTVYPIASCNDKDYHNLMHVYLDAVFYPNIYKNEKILKQEGWHYDMQSPEGELTYNGVVYNEMKGVFSSPEQQLMRAIEESLLKDTTYGCESGGDPAYIPDLTQEDFLNFHKTYYHPSNSYIYLYGNMDYEKELEFIDEHYLSHFDYLAVDSEISRQEPYKEPVRLEESYSILDTDSEENATFLAYNVVVGDGTDALLNLSMKILDYALMEMPGAALKKALIDKGIGQEVFSSYNDGILQPTYSIVAQNANPEQEEEFLATIQETLQQIYQEGLDEKIIAGAMNHFEFKIKEANFGRYPKGLMYGLDMFGSWLYDDTKVFTNLQSNCLFVQLKAKSGQRYFEQLIETYFLNNNHKTYVILKPEKGLGEKRDSALRKKLADYKTSLSQEEIQRIVDETHALKAYQEEPSTKEELESIPLLQISDIDKKSKPIYNTPKTLAGIPVVQHEIFTNGIVYLNLAFYMKKLPTEYLPYASLLADIFQAVDTKHYTYNQLANEINLLLGGISTSINAVGNKENRKECTALFEVKGKALYEHLGDLFRLMKEIMLTSKVDDEKRLKEIIGETRSQLQIQLKAAGHSTAMSRASSYISKVAYLKDCTDGIAYFSFIDDVATHFEERKQTLIQGLRETIQYLFQSDNLIISYTGDKKMDEDLTQEIEALKQALYEPYGEIAPLKFQEEKKNEGFVTASQVQYVATAGNFMDAGYEYTGALHVLKVIFSYEYLWQNVRVKGGAYGCMFGFNRFGEAYFTSYRDPNLSETYAIYKKAGEFVKNFTVDQRDMNKYIIGAISSLDTPLEPSAAGLRSFYFYLMGVTNDDIQKDRDALLATDQETIRSLAPLIDAVTDSDIICVIGGKEKVEANKALFHELSTVL